ncbi:MAG: low temperature requirement protein A [Chloroflexota bacterium]|nr:low temperature requirement protein A [Chloroflexota bacterium]
MATTETVPTQHGATVSRWFRPMVGRDRDEPHRAATPLELLFDLCFVVAVSQLAAQLHHREAEGRFPETLVGYLAVFFGIWWAWVNFTWFASAYDTDDVPYRVLTLLQIAGVLVLTAGIPAAFNEFDLRVTVAGYIVMRVALVGQWLRAACEYPPTRASSLRFAVGVGACQLGWLLRLAVPAPWTGVLFGLLALAELAVPIWAEHAGRTPWHPGHIAERYGLFTIIVLGECVLAATTAVQAAIIQSGLSSGLLVTGVGGLLLVFGMWWSYFKSSPVQALRNSLATTFIWSYAHYVLFAAVAALGAGLQVAEETAQHATHVSEVAAALSVAVPVAVYFPVLAFVHALTDGRQQVAVWPIAGTVVLLFLMAAAANVVPLAIVVLLMGVLAVGLVAVYVYRLRYVHR